MTQKPNFPARVLGVIAAVLFVVGGVAFVTIPYALGGHPGETSVRVAAAGTYHPT